MIDIAHFNAGVKRFSDSGTSIAGKAIGLEDRLANMTTELESLMLEGSEALDFLSRRRTAIGQAQSALTDDAALRTIDLLPQELQLAEGDTLPGTIAALKSAEFNAKLDEALAGKVLLDQSDSATLIEHLRSTNSYWSQDQLGSQAEKIERRLRSGGPINAHAAVMLGQPIVTAKIPTGATKQGVEFATNHVMPDAIISPPQGFATVPDATHAATEYLSQNPLSTIIGIQDADNAIHLLTAPTNTSKRTIQKTSMWGKAKPSTEPVEISANHPSVSFVIDSENRMFASHMKSKLVKGDWPAGLAPPTSPQALVDEGLAQTHVPAAIRLDFEMKATETLHDELDAGLETLISQTDNVRNERVFIRSLGDVLDAPGTGAPDTWALEPIFQERNQMMLYTKDFGAITRPLPEHTTVEAIHKANGTSLGDHNLAVIVMQDRNGTPHLAAVDWPSDRSLEGLTLHPDVRAIVSNNGGVHIRTADRTDKLKMLESVNDERLLSRLTDIFRKSFHGRPAHKNPDSAKFRPYSSDEAIHLLPNIEPGQLAQMVAEQAKLQRPGYAVFMVKLPGVEPHRYGLVSQVGISKWGRDYNWEEKVSDVVVAAIDRDGIAWLRNNIKTR